MNNLTLFLVAALALVFTARAGSAPLAETRIVLSSEPIAPLPTTPPPLDLRKVGLGRKLFQDRRLSRTNGVSCASCHSLSRGGADGQAFSLGVDGAVGEINTPTVFNSSLNFRQFWNGRAETLADQIDGPLHGKNEMASSWSEVLAKLGSDRHFCAEFEDSYPDGLNATNIKDALVAFESALITPHSRFDAYLRGDGSALSPLERRGYGNFKTLGCVACHQGVNIGGNMFAPLGVMNNFYRDRKRPLSGADLGRFTTTHLESDRFVFRVPSLRNVALTAPYFHDGSAATLEVAVRVMAKDQLGKNLNPDELASIAGFLRSLTGEAPAILKEQP